MQVLVLILIIMSWHVPFWYIERWLIGLDCLGLCQLVFEWGSSHVVRPKYYKPGWLSDRHVDMQKVAAGVEKWMVLTVDDRVGLPGLMSIGIWVRVQSCGLTVTLILQTVAAGVEKCMVLKLFFKCFWRCYCRENRCFILSLCLANGINLLWHSRSS